MRKGRTEKLMQVRLALANAIDLVRKRIQQLQDRHESIGEQNTKATMIEPILTALGWGLQDIDEVRREYKCKPQDNPVDYALFLNRMECLFIEAKSLEKDLNDRKWISQNLAYATVVGVRWCVLTNGDEYRIYNSHAEVDVEQKLFRSVRVSDTANAGQVIDTLHLLSRGQMKGSLLDELWDAHFIDRNVGLSIQSLLANEDPALIRIIRKNTKGITSSQVRVSLKRSTIRIEYPTPTMPDDKLPPLRAGQRPHKTVAAISDATIANLIQAGLIRPPLKIERAYKGVQLTALVMADGKIEFDGHCYDSLSTAAGMARKSVGNAPVNQPYPQTNGWTFWQCRDHANGELREIDHIRQNYSPAKS